ncbi:MAG TPA: GTPase domain-containing protein, partial [Tepidisphaeraceae bacterium]|nr:GTPase domain-containing protein [Tepidisphaeraceae bacterium]
MPPDLRQLVRDAADLTGAPPPDVLSPDAPTLAVADQGDDFYLVGLIGGKDVGKSAMVNALAGRDVTTITSHGPGTEGVIAYVHRSRAAAVANLLDREAAGRYRLVPHDDAALARQVLLDLPDFDSHFEHHPLLTRRMLRHMLFPVWIVSVEKYADRQPRRMLEQVAAGNAPDNFVFVLNKVDQLGDDAAAMAEIRDDHARRVGQVLNVPPPRVWMVSALRPNKYELPELRATLARERSAKVVQRSLALAAGQQDRTLVAWLDAQDLPARAERIGRVQRDAEEAVAARVAGPVLEHAVPAIEADASYVAALAEDALGLRVRRWPVVNLVHTLLGPLLAMAGTVVRGRPTLTGARPADVVDANLAPGGQPVADLVRSTFAHLRQTHPPLAELYDGRRL